MKAKHAIIILVLGWCADVVGALLKILHWPGANELFLIAMALKIIGAIILLYKVVTYPKIKEFLNR